MILGCVVVVVGMMDDNEENDDDITIMVALSILVIKVSNMLGYI